jgi:hypothetical protein
MMAHRVESSVRTNGSRHGRWLAVLVAAVVLFSCARPDNERAAEVFGDCLRRNGVEAVDVELALNSDGSVAEVSATIISEGDLTYEPTVRLACTKEVELNH